MKKISLIGSFLLVSIYAGAQVKWPWKKKSVPVIVSIDSSKVKTPGPTKPYKEIITGKAISKTGLFTVHHVEDKWFFQIPDSLLGREMLAVTRYSKTPAGGGFYAGELANQQTIYFEKGPGAKLFMRVSLLMYNADSTQAIYKAVKNTTVDPIVAVFDIKTFAPKDSAAIIDVTEFFNGDNQIVSLSQEKKQSLSLNGLANDRSFISKINTYPINTEVRTLKTFMANSGSGFGGSPIPGMPRSRTVQIPAGTVTGAVTMEMNTSFVLLPSKLMKKRLSDPRVGYFSDEYGEFSDSQEKFDMKQFIVRWRLEPRKEDLEKFNRGELVEPAKPIVYYIDPATPKKWVPYLIQGVNDWQQAFEKAGFKNAIMAKEWPADSTMSMEDARFSVIRYFASEVTNAYGPNVHDPRTGEILESHIGWYHNIVKLLRNWYMVQAAAIDPRARKPKFDDALMGQLIRFVSSHEIGHTLGLLHNFGASSTVPVENLRNKAWVEANGHTPSIMDYARFNYVAQPEDHIGPAGIYPRIGVYDKWAIEWGYKNVPEAKDEQEEKLILNRMTIDRIKADPRLWFGSELVGGDPKIQSEDLGDNSMTASAYGIKNLKRVVANLPAWTAEPADQYTNLRELHDAVTGQYATYLGHVLNNIGSSYHDPKTIEQSGDVFRPMDRLKQKQAVAWMGEYLIKEPTWLISPTYIRKLLPNPYMTFYSLADEAMQRMLSGQIFLRLIEFENSSKDPYTLKEYLTDVEDLVFAALKEHKPMSRYTRHLQKSYLEAIYQTTFMPMNNLGGNPYLNDELSKTDASSLVKARLVALKVKLKGALPTVKDATDQAHLNDLIERIGVFLNRRDK